MKQTIEINWASGDAVHIGALPSETRDLCALPKLTTSGAKRFTLSKKVSMHGNLAICVIDTVANHIKSITLLFDLNTFFDEGIVESKIIRAIELPDHQRFSPHIQPEH